MRKEKYVNLIHAAEDPMPAGQSKTLTMNDIYMNLAAMLSLKSTCRRGRAGCVVTRDSRIISTGYNGVPSKREECIEREECRQKGTKLRVFMDLWSQPIDYEIKTEGCFDSIHAEANALGFCAKNGIQTEGSVVYLTGPPCKSCAQLMVSSGVKTVFFKDVPYRNDDGIVYCQLYEINLVKVTE